MYPHLGIMSNQVEIMKYKPEVFDVTWNNDALSQTGHRVKIMTYYLALPRRQVEWIEITIY